MKKHTQRINVRLAENLNEVLLEMAALRGITLSKLIRETLSEAARSYRNHQNAE